MKQKSAKPLGRWAKEAKEEQAFMLARGYVSWPPRRKPSGCNPLQPIPKPDGAR